METQGRQRRQGKELATLPHYTDGPGQGSSLTGTPQRTDRILGITFTHIRSINESVLFPQIMLPVLIQVFSDKAVPLRLIFPDVSFSDSSKKFKFNTMFDLNDVGIVNVRDGGGL